MLPTKHTYTQAFRKQSLKYHPDKNPDKSEKATELFAKLNKAYQVLSGGSLVHSGGGGLIVPAAASRAHTLAPYCQTPRSDNCTTWVALMQ